ncbi:amidohydrolase family protein [Aurantimonas sp. MSK8Z-1]|uniref:amidohydrolase family protein n=1 Tax=Mangrovibrevibacter kandeliae TaxID=2968473 RepID=UPI0021175B1C|nr:amidohydrolase family protein [Aurantimonas sp. MSK8Z-1]MCW4113462.1 amidohydrolase family protein [Aurantimonas sp. MSK8Z-1]
MIIRTLTGDKPKIALPKGTIDTQMHMYLPGFPAVEPGPPLPEGLPGPAEYRQVMDWLGIDRVVITQGNAHQADNANLVACLEVMGEVARGVAVIGPDTAEAELQRLHAAGVRGARIMDLPGGAFGLDALEAVDAKAAAMGWVTAVQFDGAKLPQLEGRLRALKGRWILDHHAKFLSRPAGEADIAAIKRLIDRGNCWFKFAGCYESSKSGGPDYADVAAVAKAIAANAPERVIWGTNWPHNLARTTEDYPDDLALTEAVLGWMGDAASQQAILVDNPQALFGFPTA